MQTWLIFTFLLFLNLIGHSQNPNAIKEQLTSQYLENKEYDKANEYLAEFYTENPNIWFLRYYNCLIALKDYSKAEKN